MISTRRALNENRVWLYRFDLPFEGSEEQETARRVMLFSDRNVYRPGEEVHLEALVRDWGDAGPECPRRADRHAGLRGRARAPILPDQRRLQRFGWLVGAVAAAQRVARLILRAAPSGHE